jgi:hypothetical protein
VDKVKELLLLEKQAKGFLITAHLYRHVAEVSSSLYLLSNQKTYLTTSIKDLETLGYAIID